MSSLNLRTCLSLIGLFVVMAALVFVPAWTLDYWQAWAFLAAYFGSSLMIVVYLVKNDPELSRRRMSGGPTAEQRPAQRIIMVFTSLGFFGLLVVPAIDHRFGWSSMVPMVSLIGDAMVFLGFFGILQVFRENSFASATIELAADQTVISTGPYAIVRHPMYASALIMLAGIPIALGSWWGLLIIAAIMPALIWRMFDEEALLTKSLPGYTDYMRTVRPRLIPFVW